MKKTVSDAGTLHLFSDEQARLATHRGSTEDATSLCGSVESSGPFTAVAEGDLDVLRESDNTCERCGESAANEGE